MKRKFLLSEIAGALERLGIDKGKLRNALRIEPKIGREESKAIKDRLVRDGLVVLKASNKSTCGFRFLPGSWVKMRYNFVNPKTARKAAMVRNGPQPTLPLEKT